MPGCARHGSKSRLRLGREGDVTKQNTYRHDNLLYLHI